MNEDSTQSGRGAPSQRHAKEGAAENLVTRDGYGDREEGDEDVARPSA